MAKCEGSRVLTVHPLSLHVTGRPFLQIRPVVPPASYRILGTDVASECPASSGESKEIIPGCAAGAGAEPTPRLQYDALVPESLTETRQPE